MGAFVVIVTVARILVEIELAVRPAVDPQVDRSGRLFVGVLNFRPRGRIEPART